MQKNLNKILYNLAKLLPTRMIDKLIPLLERRVGIGCGTSAARSGETVVFDVLRSLSRSPLTIFDVGANQGQYATEALTALGSSLEYSIHSFEPSIKTYEILLTKHGDNERVITNHFGLGKESTTATLFTNEEGSGLASLTKRKLDHCNIDHGKLSEQIQLDTLDNFCEAKNITQIDLLKIDVEGHELDVLQGGKKMIEARNISLVQFEFGGCNIDTRTFYQDFFYFFSEQGYDLYRILPSRKLLALSKYREADEKFRTANYLAVSKQIKLLQKAPHLVV